MMYALKQWIDALATPLAIALMIAALAGVLRVCTRVRVARSLLVCALLVGYLGSIPAVGNALLAPLERRYMPLPDDRELPSARYVVVLGSGYAPRDDLPITAELDADGLVRITEGVRLVRRLGARLMLSGGAPDGSAPPARGYAEFARAFGIGDASLEVLDSSLDTSDEARAIAARVGNEPFILVTSAYHMPRAVRRMVQAGARPIPAPTGQLTYGSVSATWRDWIPNSDGLRKSERALHEYLGVAALMVGID